jgi:hypothetical protein
MKIKNIKEMIRQSILAEYNMNEDYDVETGNSDVGLRDEYDNTVEEGSINENPLDKIEQAIKAKKIDPKAVEAAAKKAMTGDASELAALMVTGQNFAKLEEAEEEEVTDEETVDIEAPAPDVPTDMPADTTMVDEPTYTPEEAAVMSDLDDALKKSQGLGDEILSDLIGNIITYFTRQHVVKEVEAGKKKHYRGAVKDDEDQISKLKKDMKFDKKQLKTESLEMLKMRKLAGLLKEGEYAKALLKEEDSDVYMSFDKEKWFDKEDKPYAGSFDFDYDEETFDDFDSFISKYGDKQKSFKPAGKSMFDMYKNKYNNMMVRKRK